MRLGITAVGVRNIRQFGRNQNIMLVVTVMIAFKHVLSLYTNYHLKPIGNHTDQYLVGISIRNGAYSASSVLVISSWSCYELLVS